jgi:hypothetical protein
MQICIKLKSRTRICIKMVWISNTGFSVTDLYNMHIRTNSQLLYGPGREILLHTLLVLPEPVLFLSWPLEDIVCSICYRLFSFQQLSCLVCSICYRLSSFKQLFCLLWSSCSLSKTAVPHCLLFRCLLQSPPDLLDLFQKQMALEGST